MIDFKIEKNNIKFTTRFLIEIPDMALSMAGEDAVEIKRRVERVVSTGNVVTRLKRLADLITFIANDIAVELPRPNNNTQGPTNELRERSLRYRSPNIAEANSADSLTTVSGLDARHPDSRIMGHFAETIDSAYVPPSPDQMQEARRALGEDDEVPF